MSSPSKWNRMNKFDVVESVKNQLLQIQFYQAAIKSDISSYQCVVNCQKRHFSPAEADPASKVKGD